MKCVQSIAQPNNVFRTSREKAQVLVLSGEYQYCSKSKWRSHGQKYGDGHDAKAGAFGKINQK